MMFNFNVWLRSRSPPSIMHYHVGRDGTDYLATAHNIMMAMSDDDWECYDVKFLVSNILNFRRNK